MASLRISNRFSRHGATDASRAEMSDEVGSKPGPETDGGAMAVRRGRIADTIRDGSAAPERRDGQRQGTGVHAAQRKINEEYFRRQPTVATEQTRNHPISRTIPINSPSLDACTEFAQHAFSLKRFGGVLSPMSKYNEEQFSYPYASIDDLFFLSKPHAPPRPPPQR